MNSIRIYLIVLMGIFAAFIPALLLRDFNALNELNYLGIAQEALERGSLFAFYDNGVPYADKPPLYLWICMLAVAIAGKYAIPLVLLASVIPFVALISILDRYLASEFRHQERLLIIMGMGSMLVLNVMALVGRMDMLFSMVMILTYLKLVKRYSLLKKSYDDPQSPRPKYGNLSIPLLLFLGTFIKGPYGILFPLLSILALMAFNRDFKRFFSVVRPHYFVIVLLLVLMWGTCVYLEGGAAYFNNLFFEQSAKRLGAISSKVIHEEPFYFFFKIFLVMTLPIGLCVLYFVIRQLYLREPLDLKIQACLSFVLVVLLVISIPKSKIEIYLLPALPMAFYYVVLSYRAMQLKAIKSLDQNQVLSAEQAGVNGHISKSDSSFTIEHDEALQSKLNEGYSNGYAHRLLKEDEEQRKQLRKARSEEDLKSETLAIQEPDSQDSLNLPKTQFTIAQPSSNDNSSIQDKDNNSEQSFSNDEAFNKSNTQDLSSTHANDQDPALKQDLAKAQGHKQEQANELEGARKSELASELEGNSKAKAKSHDKALDASKAVSERHSEAMAKGKAVSEGHSEAMAKGKALLEGEAGAEDSSQIEGADLKSRLQSVLQMDHGQAQDKPIKDHDDEEQPNKQALNEPKLNKVKAHSNKSAKAYLANKHISPALAELSERQGVNPWELVAANEPQNQTQEVKSETLVPEDSNKEPLSKEQIDKSNDSLALKDTKEDSSANDVKDISNLASTNKSDESQQLDEQAHNDEPNQLISEQLGDDAKSNLASDSLSPEERERHSGRQGIEIVGSGYFLSGINTVGERTKLPKLFSLCMVIPLLIDIALFAAYFVFYDKVLALQSPIIGIAFGVLSFVSLIALFFLLSRLFIFSLAALGMGTLSFIFILGFAIPHLNIFLGMGAYANVAIKSMEEGGSSTICINRYKDGLNLKFYDPRIKVIQDDQLLQKCLDDQATIVLNKKAIKENSHIVQEMKLRGAYMLGENLVLPAALPESKVPFNYNNGLVDNLPLELKINSSSQKDSKPN